MTGRVACVVRACACAAHLPFVRRGLVIAEEDEDADAGDEEDGGEDDDEGNESPERAPNLWAALFHVRALESHTLSSTQVTSERWCAYQWQWGNNRRGRIRISVSCSSCQGVHYVRIWG